MVIKMDLRQDLMLQMPKGEVIEFYSEKLSKQKVNPTQSPSGSKIVGLRPGFYPMGSKSD